MKQRYIHIFSLIITFSFGVLILWVYWTRPKSIDELPSKARQTIASATSKAQVVTNTYEVDPTKFKEGLNAFQANNFVLARDQFMKSDPETRDANVQFYIAYSYYRQGWGRFTNDDELFKKGLAQLNVVDSLDSNYRSSDPNLKLSTPAELRDELNEGLRVTADDFNPFRITRERN